MRLGEVSGEGHLSGAAEGERAGLAAIEDEMFRTRNWFILGSALLRLIPISACLYYAGAESGHACMDDTPGGLSTYEWVAAMTMVYYCLVFGRVFVETASGYFTEYRGRDRFAIYMFFCGLDLLGLVALWPWGVYIMAQSSCLKQGVHLAEWMAYYLITAPVHSAVEWTPAVRAVRHSSLAEVVRDAYDNSVDGEVRENPDQPGLPVQLYDDMV